MADKTPNKQTGDIKKEPMKTATPPGKGPMQHKQNEGRFDSHRLNRGDHHGHRGQHHGGGGDRGGRRGGGHPRFQRNNQSNNSNQKDGSEEGGRDGGSGYRPRAPPDYTNLEDVLPKDPKKFTGRCRLFVGNITPDMTEEEFKELFSKFGEISEVFVNGSKGFGFIRLDFRHNAEAAKTALDGTQRKGRTLRVRFANHGAAVKLKNLSPFVSNELLYQAFTQFGEVERAVVFVDERGRSLGEGIVEFCRKPGALQAIKRITEGVFLMSAYQRPVICEPLEQRDEEDGLADKFLPKNDQFRKDREKDPRFAPPGSFEHRFAMRWKELDDLEKQQHDRVKQEMEDARMKLESEMEGAMYEFQAEQIRQDLMRQQEELQRIEEMRQEQMRRRQELDIRRQEESRMIREEEDRRREMIIMRGNSDGGMRGRQGGMGGMEGGMERGRMERGGQMDQGNMREGQRARPGGHPPVPPPPAPPAAMIDNMQNEDHGGNSGFGGMGAGGHGGNLGGSGGPGVGGGHGGGQMRQSRFDNQGSGFGGGNGNFGGRNPGMGGQGAGMQGQGRQGGMQGSAGMFGGGMGGGMGGNRGNAGNAINDRRREGGGAPRDEYGEMKRMRRY